MMKDWVVPLVAGLVTAGALWGLASMGGSNGSSGESGPWTSSDMTTGPESGPPPPVVLPFSTSIGPSGGTTTFLLIAPQGNESALRQLRLDDLGEWASGFDWQTPNLAYQVEDNSREGCWILADSRVACPFDYPNSPFQAGAIPANHSAARLLHDGYNATKVTAYVFDEAGLLLASNANDTARFTLHGDFIRLPSTAWYLGANQTAPPGTAHLPGLAKPLVDKVRPELDGLPVGGVASTRSNAYVNYYGSLFVTVRIDTLVLAP